MRSFKIYGTRYEVADNGNRVEKYDILRLDENKGAWIKIGKATTLANAKEKAYDYESDLNDM